METERTGWHRKVEKWLTEEGIGFISECGDYPPYRLDVYLPDVHGVIELDGPGHLRRRDQKRDDVLSTKYGLVTLRFDTKRGLLRERTVRVIKQFMVAIGPTTHDRVNRKGNAWYAVRR